MKNKTTEVQSKLTNVTLVDMNKNQVGILIELWILKHFFFCFIVLFLQVTR